MFQVDSPCLTSHGAERSGVTAGVSAQELLGWDMPGRLGQRLLKDRENVTRFRQLFKLFYRLRLIRFTV